MFEAGDGARGRRARRGSAWARSICFDIEFPELAARARAGGADLLVTASANMEPFYAITRSPRQARALDNRLPHLYCNRCGVEAGLVFVGGSRAIRPDGTIAAQAGGGEELLSAEIGREEAGDDRIDYLAQLREGWRQCSDDSHRRQHMTTETMEQRRRPGLFTRKATGLVREARTSTRCSTT